MADKETTKLKQVRSGKGITQKELAAKTGISLRSIQHYEQGSKDLTTASAITVWRIAQALDCNIEDLIDC